MTPNKLYLGVFFVIVGQSLAAPQPLTWNEVKNGFAYIGRKAFPVIRNGCGLINTLPQQNNIPYYVQQFAGNDPRFNPVNPISPVNPVNPVDPVNPVNPVEIDTSKLAESIGIENRFNSDVPRQNFPYYPQRFGGYVPVFRPPAIENNRI